MNKYYEKNSTMGTERSMPIRIRVMGCIALVLVVSGVTHAQTTQPTETPAEAWLQRETLTDNWFTLGKQLE